MPRRRVIAKRELAADPLFRLGNHSWTHRDLHSAPADAIDSEIRSTESELAAVRKSAPGRAPPREEREREPEDPR